jgi:hypothetical protein
MTANMNLLAPVIFNNIGPYGPYLQQQQTTFIPPPTTQALLEPVTNRTPYLLKGKQKEKRPLLVFVSQITFSFFSSNNK